MKIADGEVPPGRLVMPVVEILFPLLGGLGLFLLGMALMTDGLKAFAGSALRSVLLRATATPLRAFGAGTMVTTLVQSSSATTVTVIGFVSAGLLTFPQAVALVFGASLGTTGTGWIVSGLGLKVSVGLYALPLVGLGAFARLLGSGRWREMGTALAGFAMIFIGIDFLQQGMAHVAESWDLRQLPSTGLLGYLMVMVIGVLMTVLMQSSSGAIATTLTAYHSGAISFEQAASLVIGAAVGTTVTGMIAAIGAGVPARRTAVAHILFNLATGLIAVLLLPLFLWLIGWLQQRFGLEPGAMSLAAFHTCFILLGVLLFLPGLQAFAQWIERMIPDHGPELTRHLDRTVLHVPAMALEASQRALMATAVGWFEWVRAGLVAGHQPNRSPSEEELRRALADISSFLAGVPNADGDSALVANRVAQVHALDHLTRLTSRWSRYPGQREGLMSADMNSAVAEVCAVLRLAADGLAGQRKPGWQDDVARSSRTLAEQRRQQRSSVLDETAVGSRLPEHALRLLDAMRWLDHVCYHCWRASHYLSGHSAPDNRAALDPETTSLPDTASEADDRTGSRHEAAENGGASPMNPESDQ